MTTVHIRIATPEDMPALESIAAEMKAQHEPRYFARCLEEQAAQRRTVLIAFQGDTALGYVQLNDTPTYTPFRRLSIPEVQDLNVVPNARRQGIGAALVEHCENMVRDRGGQDIAISVGLYARYGAAQRLYARRGYLPDGAGIAYDDVPVAAGEMRAVDDLLTLKMIKTFDE